LPTARSSPDLVFSPGLHLSRLLPLRFVALDRDHTSAPILHLSPEGVQLMGPTVRDGLVLACNHFFPDHFPPPRPRSPPRATLTVDPPPDVVFCSSDLFRCFQCRFPVTFPTHSYCCFFFWAACGPHSFETSVFLQALFFFFFPAGPPSLDKPRTPFFPLSNLFPPPQRLAVGLVLHSLVGVPPS